MQAQFQHKFISSLFSSTFSFLFLWENKLLFPEIHNLQGGLEFSVTSTFEIILFNYQKIIKSMKMHLMKLMSEQTRGSNKHSFPDLHSSLKPNNSQWKGQSLIKLMVSSSFPVKVTELLLMKTSYLLISRNLSDNSHWSVTQDHL